MIQSSKYADMVQSNIVRLNERRINELQHERIYHQQLLKQYESSLAVGATEERRIQFRNFVAQKLREQRWMREIDEENYHLDYLNKIRRLKQERQKLNQQMLVDRSYLALQKVKEQQQKTLVNSYLYNTERSSPGKQEKNPQLRKDYPSLNQDRNSLFFNDQLAKKVKERWVPFDKKQQPHKNELQSNERHLNQLNQKMQKLNKRQPPLKAISQEMFSHDHDLQPSSTKAKKNVSFKLQKQPIKIEQNKQKKQKKMKKKKQKTRSSPKLENSRNSLDDMPDRALKRIKNRLQLSSIVYEDSEHRIIAHEKNHLKMKYQVEEKQRKEMLARICNNKNVIQGYGYLLLGQGN